MTRGEDDVEKSAERASKRYRIGLRTEGLVRKSFSHRSSLAHAHARASATRIFAAIRRGIYFH